MYTGLVGLSQLSARRRSPAIS